MCHYISVCASRPGKTGEEPITLYITDKATGHAETAAVHDIGSDDYIEVEWLPGHTFPDVRSYSEVDEKLVYDRLVARFKSFEEFKDAIIEACPGAKPLEVGSRFVAEFRHHEYDKKMFPKHRNFYVWEVRAIRTLKENELATVSGWTTVQRAARNGWAGINGLAVKLVRRATEEDRQNAVAQTKATITI